MTFVEVAPELVGKQGSGRRKGYWRWGYDGILVEAERRIEGRW